MIEREKESLMFFFFFVNRMFAKRIAGSDVEDVRVVLGIGKVVVSRKDNSRFSIADFSSRIRAKMIEGLEDGMSVILNCSGEERKVINKEEVRELRAFSGDAIRVPVLLMHTVKHP